MGIMNLFRTYVSTQPPMLEPVHQAMVEAMVLIACGDDVVTAEEYNRVLTQLVDFIGLSPQQAESTAEETFDRVEVRGGAAAILQEIGKMRFEESERQAIYLASFAMAAVDGIVQQERKKLADLATMLLLNDAQVKDIEDSYSDL